MTTSESLEITNAITTLSSLFGEKPQEFASSLCIFHEHRLAPLNEAIKLSMKFRTADIVERGEMLGIKIHKTDKGYESEDIVLSEDSTTFGS